MRGEHDEVCRQRSRSNGSSPDARGTQVSAPSEPARSRFIPACAGNTPCDRPTSAPCPVHPRMRGEHACDPLTRASPCGSSPHARGTPHEARLPVHVPRFIPACAGNTDWRFLIPAAVFGSSPHARGTRSISRSATPAPSGSSPHARGTRTRVLARCTGSRFIPACAGNTGKSATSSRPLTVHPRMRGEHGSMTMPVCSRNGSSPHARGTRSNHLR